MESHPINVHCQSPKEQLPLQLLSDNNNKVHIQAFIDVTQDTTFDLHCIYEFIKMLIMTLEFILSVKHRHATFTGISVNTIFIHMYKEIYTTMFKYSLGKPKRCLFLHSCYSK